MKERKGTAVDDRNRPEIQAAESAGALGSTRLEGLEPTPFARECVRRVRRGEMTREEAVAALKAYHQR